MEEKWPRLQGAFQSLLRLEAFPSAIEIHTEIYKLVSSRDGRAQGAKLLANIEALAQNEAAVVFKELDSSTIDLVHSYYTSWERFSKGARYLDLCCSFLNSNYCKLSKTTKIEYPTVLEVTLHKWYTFCYYPLRVKLVREMLDIINKDRRGELVRFDEIQSVISSMPFLVHELPSKSQTSFMPTSGRKVVLYVRDFEEPFIRETESFMAGFSRSSAVTESVSDYLSKVEDYLAKELNRAQEFLQSSTIPKLRVVILQQLIGTQLHRISDQLSLIFAEDRHADLTRIYSLFKYNTGWLSILGEKFEAYLIGKSATILVAWRQTGNAKASVDSLIAFIRKATEYSVTTFQRDAEMNVILGKTCRQTLSKFDSISEMTSKLLDELLRKGKQKVDEREWENQLDGLLLVFKYLSDKDNFQHIYGRLLCRRLLSQQSIGDDQEKAVISKLKEICGYDYTIKFQRMISDLEVSADINSQYRQLSPGSSKGDFSVCVLTSNMWPLSATPQLSLLPQHMQDTVHSFEQYYHKTHPNRKLFWNHFLSRGDVKFYGYPKPYEINMSVLQISILMTFNRTDVQSTGVSVSTLLSVTGISHDVLVQQIQPLLQLKVLKKTDGAESLQLSDSILLNNDFSSERIKVRIITTQDSKEEKTKQSKHLEADRRYVLEAICVRVMKTRKIMNYESLLAEVMRQVSDRFQPSRTLLKQIVETLIEKEYLSRNDDPSLLNYVA